MIRTPTLLAAALLVAAATPPASAAPRGAVRAQTGQALTHRFVEPGVTRWHRLRVTEPAVLTVTSPTGPTRLDVMLQGHDDDQLAAGTTEWSRQTWRWSARVEPGVVYVGLSARYTDAEPTDYELGLVPLGAGEPLDDDAATAREVALGEDVALRILPADDVDHLAVQIETLGYLVARQVDAGTAERYLTFALDGRRPGPPPTWRGQERWTAWRVRPGRHVLAITAPGAMREDTRVRLELVAQDDLGEPNDVPGMAGRRALGEDIALRLLPPGDEDWLAVHLPRPGWLTCRQVGASGAPAWPRCDAFADGSDAPLLGASPFWDGQDRITTWRVDAGRHVLRLGGAAAVEPFQFRVEHEPYLDLTEPNDRPEDARPTLGDVSLRAFPPGDTDHLAIETESASLLRVTQLDPAGPAWRGALVLQGADVPTRLAFRLAQATLGEVPGARLATRVLPAGRHILALSASTWSRTPQRLRIELLPLVDAFEPNDSRDAAAAVPIGTSHAIQLHPADEDWLRVDLPSAGYLTVRFERYPAPADPTLTLFRPGSTDGEPIAWPTWATGKNYQAAIPVEAGPHELRLMDAAAGMGHPLQLALDFHPTAPPSDRFLLVDLGDGDAQLAAAAGAGGATLLRSDEAGPPALVR